MPDPVQVLAVYADDIKSAGQSPAGEESSLQAGQVILRGTDQTVLFGGIYRCGGTPVPGGASQPHFDKYQGDAVGRDQIDLASATVYITGKYAHALCAQIMYRPFFAPGS